MKPVTNRMLITAALALFVGAACGHAMRAVPRGGGSALPARADTGRRYTHADVQFMQRMIAHHAQALVMTGTVPTRTGRKDLRTLAERIDASQQAEIEMMQRWLKERDEVVPSPDGPHAHHESDGVHALMPGMLSEAELARLSGKKGARFDRLFLQYMIRHHQGALTMVSTLLGAPGAAQEPEIFRFVSDVDADQNAEITRMRKMLGAAGSKLTPR